MGSFTPPSAAPLAMPRGRTPLTPIPLPTNWQRLTDLRTVLAAGQYAHRDLYSRILNEQDKPLDSRTFQKMLDGPTMSVRVLRQLALLLGVGEADLFAFVQQRLPGDSASPATDQAATTV